MGWTDCGMTASIQAPRFFCFATVPTPSERGGNCKAKQIMSSVLMLVRSVNCCKSVMCFRG